MHRLHTVNKSGFLYKMAITINLNIENNIPPTIFNHK